MEYQGLTTDDLVNITELNRCFLRVVTASESPLYGVLSDCSLSLDEQLRLASAPFLLFSLREHDDDFWQRLLDDSPQLGLIDQGETPCAEICQLQAAGLSFLWQLARRNPYAVRLICGASVSWCERLARLALITLLARSAHRHDLLGLRFADDDMLWRRLLGHGVAKSYKLRRASHYRALQHMLTHRRASQSARLSAAACAVRAPSQQLVPQDRGGIREPKV